MSLLFDLPIDYWSDVVDWLVFVVWLIMVIKLLWLIGWM
jgi:hypothetical protein